MQFCQKVQILYVFGGHFVANRGHCHNSRCLGGYKQGYDPKNFNLDVTIFYEELVPSRNEDTQNVG